MAKELAHFKNFAKLKDTKVAFNDITVIAGKPGTGKSYVMKFMYAVNKALDLTKTEYIDLHKKFNTHTLDYIEFSKEIEKKKPESIEEAILVNGKLEDFKNTAFELMNDSQNVSLKIKKLRKRYLKNLLESIFGNMNQISDFFIVKLDSSNIVSENNNIITFTQDMQDNFNLDNDNPNNKQHPIVYSDFSMYEKQFQQEPIFVETPLILEFKKFMNHQKGKTPYHIESLLNILDTDYSFIDEEQENFIQLFREKSKEIIGGDIENNGDSFIFNQKNGKNYDILNTSSGTKSIGLLQYLVTNKALKKDSILFWEEPEVHLHPEWQLKMVDLFIELMNAGVKIVFSTHSPYMPDYLNAISKRRGFEDRVSFNLFKEKEGVVENHILDTDEKWQMIQDELLGSLEEIMWEYV